VDCPDAGKASAQSYLPIPLSKTTCSSNHMHCRSTNSCKHHRKKKQDQKPMAAGLAFDSAITTSGLLMAWMRRMCPAGCLKHCHRAVPLVMFKGRWLKAVAELLKAEAAT